MLGWEPRQRAVATFATLTRREIRGSVGKEFFRNSRKLEDAQCLVVEKRFDALRCVIGENRVIAAEDALKSAPEMRSRKFLTQSPCQIYAIVDL
jgi:hypothetical protein